MYKNINRSKCVDTEIFHDKATLLKQIKGIQRKMCLVSMLHIHYLFRSIISFKKSILPLTEFNSLNAVISNYYYTYDMNKIFNIGPVWATIS